MVTKTEEPVSQATPAASENEPPASEPAKGQEPVGASQEQGAEAERNLTERVKADLAADIAEATKRAQQSGFDQGKEQWKARQRQDEEHTALVKDYDRAKEALRKAVPGGDADEIARLSDRVAQAGAVAEHIPQLRREYRESREELPGADQWTEAELDAFNERGTTGKREGANVLRAVRDATWRQATEQGRAEGAKTEKERIDNYLRGEPPPRISGGGMPLPKELSYAQLEHLYGIGTATDDQRAEYLQQRAERRR